MPRARSLRNWRQGLLPSSHWQVLVRRRQCSLGNMKGLAACCVWRVLLCQIDAFICVELQKAKCLSHFSWCSHNLPSNAVSGNTVPVLQASDQCGCTTHHVALYLRDAQDLHPIYKCRTTRG